jgi:hypothetical protein
VRRPLAHTACEPFETVFLFVLAVKTVTDRSASSTRWIGRLGVGAVRPDAAELSKRSLEGRGGVRPTTHQEVSMATHHDPPTKEAEEKRINRDKDHGGFSEDVGPDAGHAGPSSSNPPGS